MNARTAITAANTGTADAGQQIMLADAAATLLPDPVTVSKYFVLFAWLVLRAADWNALQPAQQ